MRKGAAGQAPPQPWSSLRIRVRRLLSLTELRVRDGAGNGAAGGGVSSKGMAGVRDWGLVPILPQGPLAPAR